MWQSWIVPFFSCHYSRYYTSHLGSYFFCLHKLLLQSSVFQGVFVTASPSLVCLLFSLHIPLSLLRVPLSACISCLTNFSPLFFSFVPPKPEGIEKETTQNSVLCVKGKARSPYSLRLFLCSLMGGMCLKKEDSAASIVFQIGWCFYLIKTWHISWELETKDVENGLFCLSIRIWARTDLAWLFASLLSCLLTLELQALSPVFQARERAVESRSGPISGCGWFHANCFIARENWSDWSQGISHRKCSCCFIEVSSSSITRFLRPLWSCLCLVSLSGAPVKEKFSLLLPSNVVQDSGRAYFSVLGEWVVWQKNHVLFLPLCVGLSSVS